MLPHTVEAPRDARNQLDDLLRGRCSAPVAEVAALITSELVANAVVHAFPPVWFRAEITDAVIRVEIHDRSTSIRVAPMAAGPTEVAGRGLMMVEALASRWGTEPTDDGKFVWFELSNE